MQDYLTGILLLALYFLLQLVILPKLGVPTCMSPACRVPAEPKEQPQLQHAENAANASLPHEQGAQADR